MSGSRFAASGALRDVSFAINPGEVVCLLGDNGAGKSTLVKIMSGVHSPDRGRLLVRGQPVARWSPKSSRRAGIETIYQDKALAPRQTVARNIFMGRELTNAFGLIADRRQAAQADFAAASPRLHVEDPRRELADRRPVGWRAGRGGDRAGGLF